MTREQAIRMYGVNRVNAMTSCNNAPMGSLIDTIWGGLKTAGGTALAIYTGAKTSDVYKAQLEEQQKAQANLLKYGLIAAALIVGLKVVKG